MNIESKGLNLELAHNLWLPLNEAAADSAGLIGTAGPQTFAFIAKRGAGKTYAAGVLVEGFVRAGIQVVILDVVGVWWGLRLASDGKSPGLPIITLGGLHGDRALPATSGAAVADVVVDTGASFILDVTMFGSKADWRRFAADFAERLLIRKRQSRSLLHLVIEEAQEFVPQRVDASAARMVGAFESLVKLGRNFGVGVTLISQRPQAVHKDVLNQTECLVVLQTNGSQERKALASWVVENDGDRAMLSELPKLRRGEAYVWSPNWLRCFQRVDICKKTTFDASSTPTARSREESKSLAPVELPEALAALDKALATVEPKGKKGPSPVASSIAHEAMKAANVRLQARLTMLENREQAILNGYRAVAQGVLTLGKALGVDSDENAASRDKVRANGMPSMFGDSDDKAAMDAAVIQAAGGKPVFIIKHGPGGFPTTIQAKTVDGGPGYVDVKVERYGLVERSVSEAVRAEMRMLAALLGSDGQRASYRDLAVLCGIKPKGSTMSVYLSKLRTSGYISGAGKGEISATDAARSAGVAPMRVTGADVVARLRSKPGQIVRLLVALGPEHAGLLKSEIGTNLNISGQGSTLSVYISKVTSAGLVLKSGVRYVANPILWRQ